MQLRIVLVNYIANSTTRHLREEVRCSRVPLLPSEFHQAARMHRWVDRRKRNVYSLSVGI